MHFRLVRLLLSTQLAICSVIAATSVLAAPADESLSDRIDRLIRQLGHDEFVLREGAQKELLKIGSDAFDALTDAQRNEDIEIAARAKYLVRIIRVEWTRSSDSQQVKDLLKDYEQQEEAVRLQRIAALARLPDDAGLSALCRIARFEKSPLVSRQAALASLARDPPAESDRAVRERTVRESLGKSRGAPADWLRLDARADFAPDDLLAAWDKLIADETALLKRTSGQTSNEIVAALLRKQVERLERFERRDKAQAAILKIVDIDPGTPQTLPKLIEWLADRKAWDALDATATRHAGLIDQTPLLIYRLAAARAMQGKPEVAEELAQKALKLQPGEQFAHYQLGGDLQKRGLFKWAEQEYRLAAATPVGREANPAVAYFSQTMLAEMLHDQEDQEGAAAALRQLVGTLDSNPALKQQAEGMGRSMGSLRSRMHYFAAKHLESRGETAQQIEELEKGVEHDPTDADVLISLHRLPNQDEARRTKTLGLIESAAEEFRKQIQESPQEANPYNQLAWLIGNTEGDQAEALRCSLKSLEISPNAASYMDTLGRCYYASKDLESALKWQRKAIELEPHHGAMKRQLKFFEEEAAKAKAKSS